LQPLVRRKGVFREESVMLGACTLFGAFTILSFYMFSPEIALQQLGEKITHIFIYKV